MALHRCAACGSAKVITDTQNGGVSYNYKKGVAGTVVFGVGGAVAGIENKNQHVFICQDCGITLTYEMPGEIRAAIDLCLDSEEARYRCLSKTGLDWNFLKKKYKNIEDGSVDRDRAYRKKQREEEFKSRVTATATKEEFDEAVNFLSDFCWKYKADMLPLPNRTYSSSNGIDKSNFSESNHMKLSEYHTFKNALTVFIENIPKFFPGGFPEDGYKSGKITKDQFGFERIHEIAYYNFKSIFSAYLLEKFIEEYDQLPIFVHYDYNKDFRNFLDEYPYIAELALKCDYHLNPTIYSKDLSRYIDPIQKFCRDCSRYIYRDTEFFFMKIGFPLKDSNDRDIGIRCLVPIYITKNGDLYSAIRTVNELQDHTKENSKIFLDLYTREGEKMGKKAMEYYFTVYPEKRSEFDAKIAARKQQLAEKDTMTSTLKSYEAVIKENSEKITANKNEIKRLQSKIFGKKAALAKAAELEAENSQLEAKSQELTVKSNEMKQKLGNITSDREFYKQLTEEMDSFIVWQCVEKAKRK